MSLDTRGIDPQRLLPQSLEDRLLGWLGRCGGLVLLGAVLILWMGLLSWSVADPSLTHATGVGPRNWLGPLGAIASDLLLQMLGLGAIAALLAPMFWAVELTRRERLASPRAMVGYYPLSILALAGGLSALPTIADWPLHHGLGGVVGDGLFKLATKAFSVVNEDRARLAAGIGLNAGGLAMMGKSIALDLEGLRAAIFPIRAGDDAPGETLASWMSRWAARWRQWRASREHRKQRPAFAPAARPAASADYAPGQRDFGSHTLFVPERVVPERAAPVPRQSYVLAAGFEGYGSPQAGGDTHSSADETGSSFAAYEAEHRPPQSDLLESDLVRDDDFDQSTEAASRAIAARFAPPGANVASQPSQAAPGKSPMAAAKISGLLGGVPFRKAQPDWKRPSLNLLKRPAVSRPGPEFTQTVMRGNARLLEDVLKDFGVKGEVKDIRPGPVVTLYELEPARGTKSSRVIGLADDIARSMSVASVRASVISGRNAIGLELPNVRREPVLLREMLDSDAYKASEAALPLALGKSIGGDPVVVDLARMPHLLVAGTTGSGKSVGINAMVLSLLYRHSPRECRMLMIDPKMLELSVYNGIPHLLTPVITDPHKAVAALNWAVSEMEERYKRMATLSVRNIDVFNNRVRNARKRGELLSRTVQTGFDKSGQAIFENQKMNLEPMPHIVVVVDEFADLMIVAGKDVETAVQRLAQMARAAGIHLIMATQRPSVDIITGTIKANFPTRISFKVTSKIDSRTILNEQGAEQLLGQGDMLYSMGAGQVVRVHGAFVADEEVEAVADALRQQGPPHYVEGILDAPSAAQSAGGDRMASDDDLYDRAVAIVLRDRKASTSYIQRRLSIGYNRAADLIERMEREGLITPANSVGKREILGSGNVDAA